MVLPVPGGDALETINGVMVVPGLRAYEGSYDRREVRGVRYSRQASGDRETFVNLLYPLGTESDPAGTTVTPLDLRGVGEACAVETAQGRDLVVVAANDERDSWQVEEWGSDARLLVVRDSGAWAAADMRQIVLGGTPVFAATTTVRSAAFWPTDEGITGQISTRRATTISLPGEPGGGQVAVNGIVIPTSKSKGVLSFLLPAEGVYRITVDGER
jgi:hypothetical protein